LTSTANYLEWSEQLCAHSLLVPNYNILDAKSK